VKDLADPLIYILGITAHKFVFARKSPSLYIMYLQPLGMENVY